MKFTEMSFAGSKYSGTDTSRTLEPDTRPPSGEDAIEIVRTESPMAWKQYYENGIEIYRGLNAHKYKEVLYKGNSGTGRSSAYTTNHFTLILGWLSNWSHVPKRSESWICSTSKHTAGGFGALFTVFPIEDVEIAFCRTDDFWNAFGWTLQAYDTSSLNVFNDKFSQLFTDASAEAMIDQIKLFDKIGIQEYMKQDQSLEIHKLSPHVGRFRNKTIQFFDEIVGDHGSVMKALEHIFDPTNVGITVHNFSDLTPKDLEPNVECWFSGPTHFLNRAPGNLVQTPFTGFAKDEVHESSDSGTFIGIRLSDKSNSQLEEWCHQHNLNCEDLHVTLVLDGKKQIPYDPEDVSITLDPDTFRFEVFDDQLVLRFNNGQLSKKHMMLRNTYDIPWEYDEYKPHITVDSEWGKDVPDFDAPDFPIELSHEYKTGFDK